MDDLQFQNLMKQLASLSTETEWVERKLNQADPSEIGEYISALSNASALIGKQKAYMLWGMEDANQQIRGTSFRPRQKKVGNQDLEIWLLTLLDPQVEFRFHEGIVDGNHVVLLEITPATHLPIRFKGVAYIRVGGSKRKLHDCPEKERGLWRVFDKVPFEKGMAMEGVSEADLLSLIDYPAYFQIMHQPLPENRSGILQKLMSEKVIFRRDDGAYNITNVGAILFAKNIEDFDHLITKVPRIIFYKNDNRVETIKEHRVNKGYAIGFNEIVDYINDQLPQNEEIGQAFRRVVRMYPVIAIRELVANALIHQNFTITGAGPMVEIFNQRVEISNPGIPLIDTLRFIDEPPISRNEMLVSFMRRLDICEQRGSGVDKAILEIELYQLPPPDFRVTGQSVITTLYAPRKCAQMNPKERMRACYQHASLQYIAEKKMTNESLRNRLGIKKSSYTMASKIIKDSIESNLIKPYGVETSAGKGASYLPFWA